MTLRTYLWGLRIGTVLLISAWVVVLVTIDPEISGMVGQVLFYITFFCSLAGIYILFLTWLWRKVAHEDFSVSEIGMGFRQGILLAFLTIILIFFQQTDILIWWSALLVTAGVLLIELYFLSSQR